MNQNGYDYDFGAKVGKEVGLELGREIFVFGLGLILLGILE